MSSIVSRRPSFRNQSKEAFWMSIRLGRSRTCFRREKLLRARGAATVVVKVGISLPYGSEGGTGQNVGGTAQHSGKRPPSARQASRTGRVLRRTIANRLEKWKGPFCGPFPHQRLLLELD